MDEEVLPALEIIDAGTANVNDPYEGGDTAIIFAAMGKSLELVQALIKAGADVTAKGENDNTALHWAVGETLEVGLDIAKCLIEAGADVNARNKQHNTPLKRACTPQMMELIRSMGGVE